MSEQQSQIVDLSGQSPQDVLDTVAKLLQESEFQRFTLLLVRRPAKLNESILNSVTTKFVPHHALHNSLPRNSASLRVRCISDISARNGPATASQQGEDSREDALTTGLRLYDQGEFSLALQVLAQEEGELRQSLKEGAGAVKLYQDVNFHIGNCHYRLKDYEAAVKFFGKEFDGEDARQRGQKHNNLGSCYAHLNQSRLSLRSYSQALKIYADFPEIDCANLLNNLAMLYAQSAMYETAERYLLKSIEERRLKSPENSNALYLSYLHLANCQKHARKYLQAIGSLSSALALAGRGFGSEGETLMQLAGLYEMVEQWTDALDCYQRLSRREEDKGYLFERAAHIHRFMGHFSDYERFINKAYECYRAEGNDRKVQELERLVAQAKK